MTDRIILSGMQFYGFHGANPEERVLGQPFAVDLAVELDLRRPGATDNLADTVSYSHLHRAVKGVMEGEPRRLLEAAAQEIARRILSDYPLAQTVLVTVKKLRPPIKGSHLDYAAVEISRRRADFGLP